MSSSHHFSCFKIPRKLASTGVGVEEFVEDYLLDGTDEGDVLVDRKKDIIRMLQEAASKTKAKTKKVKSEDDAPANIMDRLKEATKIDDGDDVEEPARKKAKTKSKKKTEEDSFKAMLSVYRKYHKGKTVAELKDMLRWNKQILGGTKAFVLFKVIDGELNGRLSLCPLCQGDLKFLEGDYDTIHCGGRFDEGVCNVAAANDVGRYMFLNCKAVRHSKISHYFVFYISVVTRHGTPDPLLVYDSATYNSRICPCPAVLHRRAIGGRKRCDGKVSRRGTGGRRRQWNRQSRGPRASKGCQIPRTGF